MNSVITPVKTEERVKLGIKPGDTVRVHQKVVEKGKTRLQVFEGLVLAVKHGTEPGATFTVRATMSGIGVEKIFPLYSPIIDKIEITKRSKVRRAKLYFIREKVAREVRRQLRNMRMVKLSTEDFKEEEKPEEPAAPAEDVTVEVDTVPEGDQDVVTPEEVAAEEAREEKKNEEA
ncbi:MAG TPA: 50S ribosomal protein L19 [Candidatus Paceibacterota bacterium]